MSIRQDIRGTLGSVREDFIPASDYVSREFAELERERLWPRVWQVACREQNVAEVGDFYTYDILDDSIIVVRTGEDEIKAFHNACAHRGRRLTSGCGHMARFHCRFHGWQYDLHGRPLQVVDREDWGDRLRDDDISLMPVRTGRWGGWVYINMDPHGESLEEALAPASAVLDPLDLAGLSYHWIKYAVVPCNWKTALGMFDEGYHVQQAHRQVLRFQDDITGSHAHGRHGMFENWEAALPGVPSRRLGGGEIADVRPMLKEYIDEYAETLDSAHPITMRGAAERMMAEVPAGTPVETCLAKVMEFTIEEALAKGIAVPPVTPEQVWQVGTDWHLFPNQVILPGPLTCLGYRARPNGNDPDSAIFEVFSLLRYPAGKAPKVVPERNDDLTDRDFWPKIFIQDFENMADVQRGLKSRGFRGARPNPKQEVALSNFHRALHEFILAP